MQKMNRISGQRDPKLSTRIKGWMRPPPCVEAEILIKWRERILSAALITALILSVPALMSAILVGIRGRIWALVLVDSTVYLAAWCLFIFRAIDYEIRACTVVALVYLVGLNVCVQVSLFSGGPAYLFTAAILAGLLIGLRAAVIMVALNSVTVVTLVVFITGGYLSNEHLFFPSMERAIAAGASYILLNAVSAISAAVLVRGLHRVTTRQIELTNELFIEKAELIETRQKLHLEIEERRRSEKALRQSEAQYRLLAENISDVIFTMDMEMNYTYISPAVERLQGWKPQELLGKNVETVLPSQSAQLASETLVSKLAMGETTGDYHRTVVLEIELLCKDGAPVWCEVTAGFLLGDDAKPVAILGVTRDISERLRVQREREKLHEQLARSKKMEALGLLAGGVAHDLNNVLSGIVSYPDLLLLDMDAANPLYKPISAIRHSGQKAAAIVQDLLTLARRGVVTAEILNLNSVIQEYLQSPEHEKLLYFHNETEVRTRLPVDLPNMRGSSIHLKKTLMNLISNAAEAQPHGGIIFINTECRYLDRPVKGYSHVAEGEYILMTVSDQGEGITAEDLPHIFEPFYTKKVMGRSGTGLGMAVVWGTVQDHAGYIDVESTPGRGTAFSLYFPVSKKNLTTRHVPPLETYEGHGESVLVVDDVSEQREIAVNLLSRLNYRPIAVSSGEEAIDYIKNNVVDLLILDMIMDPGMDGLDTYRAVLACRPNQKAIIASGYAETERVREALKLGAGPYVKKPYTIENIGIAIRRALAAGSHPA